MCGGGGIPILSDIGDFFKDIISPTAPQPNSPTPVAETAATTTTETQGSAAGEPQTMPPMISSLLSGDTSAGNYENLSTMNLGSGYVPEDAWAKILETLRGNQG